MHGRERKSESERERGREREREREREKERERKRARARAIERKGPQRGTADAEAAARGSVDVVAWLGQRESERDNESQRERQVTREREGKRERARERDHDGALRARLAGAARGAVAAVARRGEVRYLRDPWLRDSCALRRPPCCCWLCSTRSRTSRLRVRVCACLHKYVYVNEFVCVC